MQRGPDKSASRRLRCISPKPVSRVFGVHNPNGVALHLAFIVTYLVNFLQEDSVTLLLGSASPKIVNDKGRYHTLK
jgi:hypothetical protein